MTIYCGIAFCSFLAAHEIGKEEPSNEVAALIQRNCFDCHSGEVFEGGLRLDLLLEDPSNDEYRKEWWKVLNNVRAGTMPPPDSGLRLSDTEKKSLSHWFKYVAMGIDPEHPDPGHVTLRRLNRREYSNTVRDLMGIDFNADIVFPPDDSGSGFDNNGDALNLSTMLVEKYVAAAADIVDKSVPKADRAIGQQKFFGRDFKSNEGGNGENMRMQRAARVERSFDVAIAGEYRLDIDLRTHGTFEFSPQRCTVVCKLDGQFLFERELGWDESKHHLQQFERDWDVSSHTLEFSLLPIPLEEGVPVNEDIRAELTIDSVTLVGPKDSAHWKEPIGYHRFFPLSKAPEADSERRAYAKEVLSAFVLKAYRRPASDSTIDKLVEIAESFYGQPGMSFEAGIGQAMTTVLASPRFLFKREGVMDDSSSDRFPLIDEYALASRLSYFLWSTMPDDELYALAKEGKLRTQLDAQIQRMLDDRRSNALVQNFVGQWLRTRDVEKVSIDALAVFGMQKEFDEALAEFRRRRDRRQPNADATNDAEFESRRKRFRELAAVRDTLDGDVRHAMRRETEMLFEGIAKENRSLLEIVDPGYTYLNEKLAKHYGIPDVKGGEMRRVPLPSDSPRGGILTHGSMLTVTSNPTRTSPVKRGLFVLDNILGTPTPPAPPNVPALEDASVQFGGRDPSLRELLAAHRESALCASCHSRMDPLGLALENYNALGMWRDKENGQAIETNGQLITGEKFANVQDLRRTIAKLRREDFYRCISQKMLVYALGRGLDYYDEHTIDRIVDKLRDDEGKFRTLIVGIIRSDAFQRQRSQHEIHLSKAQEKP